MHSLEQSLHQVVQRAVCWHDCDRGEEEIGASKRAERCLVSVHNIDAAKRTIIADKVKE